MAAVLCPAGEDEVEQLLCIMEIMGVPPHHLIDAASRKKVFFDANNQPTVVPNSRGDIDAPLSAAGNMYVVLSALLRISFACAACAFNMFSMQTDSAFHVMPCLSAGKLRHPGAKTLWGVLRCKDPGFVDLLEGCLRWDPAERMTPEDAMNHPWMAEMREQQHGRYVELEPPLICVPHLRV